MMPIRSRRFKPPRLDHEPLSPPKAGSVRRAVRITAAMIRIHNIASIPVLCQRAISFFHHADREVGVNPTAETGNQLRHRLYIGGGDTEIHDAKTESVLSVDHSIGNESLAALFDRFQHAPIQ